MALSNPYAQYVDNQMNTASPGKLVIMAYDAAMRFARTAMERMREGRIDQQSENIKKVQNILLELIAALDPKYDAHLAANLDALYTYMFDRLTHASLHDDVEALQEVISILTDLRSAWVQADMAVRRGMLSASEPERRAA